MQFEEKREGKWTMSLQQQWCIGAFTLLTRYLSYTHAFNPLS